MSSTTSTGGGGEDDGGEGESPKQRMQPHNKSTLRIIRSPTRAGAPVSEFCTSISRILLTDGCRPPVSVPRFPVRRFDPNRFSKIAKRSKTFRRPAAGKLSGWTDLTLKKIGLQKNTRFYRASSKKSSSFRFATEFRPENDAWPNPKKGKGKEKRVFFTGRANAGFLRLVL